MPSFVSRHFLIDLMKQPQYGSTQSLSNIIAIYTLFQHSGDSLYNLLGVFFLQLHILILQAVWALLSCISIFMFTQYTDSCASNLVFIIAIWLLCSWFNICICNLRRYYYSFAFYSHTVYHGQLMSDGPVFLYFSWHIIFFVWPTLYDIGFGLLQVCFSGCCFLYISHECTHWQVHCCVGSIDIMLRTHVSLSLFS